MHPTNDRPGWEAPPAQPPTAWPGTPAPPGPATPPGVPVPPDQGWAPGSTATPEPPASPAPARSAPALDRRASGPGAVAVATGLVAALAPLTEWYRITMELPGLTTSMTTTGWGSAARQTSYETSGDGPIAGGWVDWTLAGIPDGAVASVLAVVIAAAGLRMVFPGGRSTRAASTVVSIAGTAGLVWTYLAWRTGKGTTWRLEELLENSGTLPSHIDEAVSGHVGVALVVCAVGFVLAALAGFRALWAATPASPPRTEQPSPT